MLALLRFDPDLVRRLLLEGFKGAGQRADFVLARGVTGVDGEIAGGDLQHRVAHVVQRPDHAAGDHRHRAERQSEGGGQQRELQHQRVHGAGILHRRVIAGGVERAFGHTDGGAEASDRDRAPLVRGQFGLFAGDHRLQQALAQVEIGLFEIGLLNGLNRAGQCRRQLHAGGGQLQCVPCCFGTADEFGKRQPRFCRDPVQRQSVRNQQRRFAGSVTQQPGDLLDGEQLVDRGVLVVDAAGEHARQLVEDVQQSLGRFHIFLGQRRAARRRRLRHQLPEFLLPVEQAVEFGDQCLLLGEFDLAEQRERIAHTRHFGVAQRAQIFLDISVQRRAAVQQPVGGGAVGAQIVHRLEHVGGSIGDDGDAAGLLQAPPGVPGVERKSDHHAEGGGEDDGLQQRGYGQAIQHGIPPRLPAIWGEKGKYLDSLNAVLLRGSLK